MNKIYTKTGDKGTTSLFDGTRVYKDNIRVCPYGMVDELNSIVGIVLSYVKENKKSFAKHFQKILEQTQSDLLIIGSHLANPTPSTEIMHTDILKKNTLYFEEAIDTMTEKMPPLKNFILPGGGKIGSFLHLARTVSRRAERDIVTLSQKEHVDNSILVYMNRLSDLFFTMSRFSNFEENQKEIIWKI